MKTPTFLLIVVLTGAWPSASRAEMAPVVSVPVERIIQNTLQKLQNIPERGNDSLIYNLGRTYHYAFLLKKSEVLATSGEDKTADSVIHLRNHALREDGEVRGADLSVADAMPYAGKAAETFRQVIAKGKNRGWYDLANLGLALLLEQVSKETRDHPHLKLPESVARHDGATIRQHSLAAFQEAWKREQQYLRRSSRGPSTACEAAELFVRSAKAEAEKLTPEERADLARMEAAIKTMDSWPLREERISPLIFSFRRGVSIAGLLAPERSVSFDLRGFGTAERWPWLRPETAILVWDPAGEGRITSGRQLFGNYSWQFLWQNGFEALAALDDNQDGWIRGTELEGIRVWQDRNQNAVSEAGELTSLAALGVTGFACAAPEAEGIHPLHRTGVEMKDGRRLPLWDWYASPVQAEPVAAR